MTDIRIGVIGLDGLSWNYFNKILSSGAIPYTKTIVERELNHICLPLHLGLA